MATDEASVWRSWTRRPERDDPAKHTANTVGLGQGNAAAQATNSN